MFSRSKRFESKTVGCGADAVYNPKELIRPIGGVIPKVERFNDLHSNESVSDADSVHSDKSAVFRTPKSLRKIAVTSASKKQIGNTVSFTRSMSTDSVTKDIINSKNVEIRNKNETIAEYEQQIKEMKLIIQKLNEENKIFKSDVENLIGNLSQCNCNELKEDLALVKSHHSLALEANESIRHEYKIETESLKNQHQSELDKMRCDYTEKINKIEENCYTQIKQIEEDSSEKIKICEVQHEERCQEIVTYHDSILKREKQNWLSDMQKCQEIAENEIIKSETQIQKLKSIVHDCNENVKDLSNNVITLEKTIQSKENQLQDLNSQLQDAESNLSKEKVQHECEIKKFVTEIESLDKKKHTLAFTLEITQKAVEALGTRLLQSDEHVENLQRDLESLKLEKQQNQSNLELVMKDLTKLKDLECKVICKHDLYLDMKSQCDEAFKTIKDCQTLLFSAECQLETKDQELNELSTENDRLSGTLAAVDQEKNELQVLLNEFKHLMEEKNNKIHVYCQKIHELEDRLRKGNSFLEATDFIVKEKDKEINKLQEELRLIDTKSYEYQTLQNVIIDLKDKILNLENEIFENHEHFKTCREEMLQSQCRNLESDLQEMTSKYTNLLGHQNNKQKIKHVIDLKTQNSLLKEENEKLIYLSQKKASVIEKLNREIVNLSNNKSPLAQRKPLGVCTSSGKENTSPMGKSPKLHGSPKTIEKPLTPLRDLNR